MEENILISIRNLQKIYCNDGVKTAALRGVNLEINRGEFVAIMGTSGSGKSSLLHVLGCMDEMTDGEYLFNGKNIRAMERKEINTFRAQNIGFVFQHFALMKYYTVYENIEMPLWVADIPKRERRGLIEKVMKELGIASLEKKKVTHISGGQQARTAIARALVNRPSVILADEPTGALDSKTSEEIMKCFEEIHREGATIIMVTHDSKVAEHADRVVYLEDGVILES